VVYEGHLHVKDIIANSKEREIIEFGLAILYTLAKDPTGNK
jgi:hypothetical protein